MTTNQVQENTLMVTKDVIEFYSELESAGIKIWVDGGWSVDALLDKQLRPHRDIDIALEWKNVPKLREILTAKGYSRSKKIVSGILFFKMTMDTR